MDKKAQTTLHLIIGVLLISGGLLYFLNLPYLGALIAGLGIFTELIINFLRNLK